MKGWITGLCYVLALFCFFRAALRKNGRDCRRFTADSGKKGTGGADGQQLCVLFPLSW